MKLDRGQVPSLDGRAEWLFVIGNPGNDLRIIGNREIGVNKIKKGVLRQIQVEVRIFIPVDRIPSHVGDFLAWFEGLIAAFEDSQPEFSRRLMAGFEQQLQPKADPEIRAVLLDVPAQGFNKPHFFQLVG